MGSPFVEESEAHLVLDLRDIMNVTVGETGRNVEALGEEQYLSFVEERLVQSAKHITEPLPKNKQPVLLFSRQSVNPKSKHKGQVTSHRTSIYIVKQ